MASAVSRSISSPSARHTHFQSQSSLSLSQSFQAVDPSNLNDSLSSTLNSVNPLVTIIYSTTSSPKDMETSRRNSTINSAAAIRAAEAKKQYISGNCTFFRLTYGDNQQLLLNSYASCRRLLDHIKPVVGFQQDETIDLMDNEGKLKELNSHSEEYGSTFLTARNTYYVLKVEIDGLSGDKRYTLNLNIEQIDPKLQTILTNSLNSLNKAGPKKKPVGSSRPNASAQSASNNAQTRNKRVPSRKQT